MSFRLRIAAWVVLSCSVLIAVMMVTGHQQLEEELRQGHKDRTHPDIEGWIIHNSYAESEIQDILDELMQTWLWTAIPVVGLALGAGLLLARRSLRPIHELNRQLAAMQPHALHGHIIVPETDPILADLARHLNNLLDRAGAAYEEMAEFSARVAHELRTPLMLLRTRLEHAPAAMPPAFQEELQDELARLSRFVERALLAARAEQGTLQPERIAFDLSTLLRDVTDDYQLLAGERNLPMRVEVQPDLWLEGSPDLTRQILHGLLENATRYAASSVSVSCGAHGDRIAVDIRNDCGPGAVTPAGLGLGLRLVRAIGKASGMEIAIHQDEHNYHVRILIPRMKNEPNAQRGL